MRPDFLIQCTRCHTGLVTLHRQGERQQWLVLICHGCDAVALRGILPLPEGQVVPPLPAPRRRVRQSHPDRCGCRECLASL